MTRRRFARELLADLPLLWAWLKDRLDGKPMLVIVSLAIVVLAIGIGMM